jgi:hypothetical protein
MISDDILRCVEVFSINFGPIGEKKADDIPGYRIVEGRLSLSLYRSVPHIYSRIQ